MIVHLVMTNNSKFLKKITISFIGFDSRGTSDLYAKNIIINLKTDKKIFRMGNFVWKLAKKYFDLFKTLDPMNNS